MKYDFTTLPDRRGKDAIAVEQIPIEGAKIRDGFSRLPMWVADMNFPTAPSIVDAMAQRIAHPLFGYFPMNDAYYDAIIHWQAHRNGVSGLQKEHIGYENGVLGGVVSAMHILAEPGAKVLLHSPTYIGFTGCLTNNGYT
ncbi:MAG: aspartate aminotransferase, partial [Acutalibacteraceae bacterium]